MIKWLLHKMTRRMEQEWDYDASYMHEIIDISSGAALRSMGLPLIMQTRGPAPAVWIGAALGSVLEGDCGPCAQLMITQALRAGTPEDVLQACLERRFDDASDVGLGFRFAEAAILDAPELEALRQAIADKHGQHAVISASFAAASARAYPVIKRGLGHGQACQRLELAPGHMVALQKAA